MSHNDSESVVRLLVRSRSESLLLEYMRAQALENYHYGTGRKPGGYEGPEPYLRERMAVQDILSSITFTNPEGNDPEGHGPGGPVMQDILTTISIAHLSSSLSNKELGGRLRTVALEQLANQVQELQKQG